MSNLFGKIFTLRIADFLSLLEYTDEIIGITAIVIALFGYTIASTAKDKDSLRVLTTYCVAACCILVVLANWVNKNWCVVPNLYGRSYSDAIALLQDNDLDCTVLLSSSNENLSHENVRVVWQSRERDTVSRKGETVFVVLDNNFGYEYNPLSKPLGFIDGRDWLWKKHNSTIFVQMPLAYENMKTSAPQAIVFDVYATSFAATLEIIVTDYLESNIIDIQIEYGTFDDYLFVGKLCTYNTQDYHMKSTDAESLNGKILLPTVIHNDSYVFYFSFYDQEGNHYDHAIPIKFVSEYEWEK